MIRLLRDKVVPLELRKLVDQELDPGEQVQWMGTPTPRIFTGSSLVTFLFSFPWTAFAVFWIYGASGFKIPDFKEGFDPFPLFGVPFVLVGIGMFLSPIFAYWIAKKTVYAVTDKRAIAIKGVRSRTVRAFYPEELGGVFRRERKDGTGDIVISRREWTDARNRVRSEEVGFVGIDDPKKVEAMLRALHEQGSGE